MRQKLETEEEVKMGGKRKLRGGAQPVYITPCDCAARTGLSIRYFQELAKRVPFASQPEPGGPILFDEAGFDAWLDNGRPAQFRGSRPIGKRIPPTPPVKLSDGEQPLRERLREMRKELIAGKKSR